MTGARSFERFARDQRDGEPREPPHVPTSPRLLDLELWPGAVSSDPDAGSLVRAVFWRDESDRGRGRFVLDPHGLHDHIAYRGPLQR